jgi:hypothetical protein
MSSAGSWLLHAGPRRDRRGHRPPADLSLDSLQVMNLLLHIEDRFDISIPVNILLT